MVAEETGTRVPEPTEELRVHGARKGPVETAAAWVLGK
jgi:hypothetical protein